MSTKQRLTISLTQRQHEALTARAENLQISISELIRRMLDAMEDAKC